MNCIQESARSIPVAYEVDVLVVGGSTGAVSAAVAAAASGARVFVAAPRLYLGEDMCATLRLWLEEGEEPRAPLARQIFDTQCGVDYIACQDGAATDTGCHSLVKPFRVKKALDQALLDAGVPFLFGCYASDVLRDATGNPCGIVMANRAGRQAVVAKMTIDATDRAWVALMAGATFTPFPAGLHTFKRVVIGGEIRGGENLAARRIGLAFVSSDAKKESAGSVMHEVVEYALQIPMQDGRYPSLAEAEQRARDLTNHEGQVRASETLFQVPPDPVRGLKAGGPEWQGVDQLGLAAFRPAGVPRLFVLGGCADLPREHAEKLLRPLALIDLGARVGAAAAGAAKELPTPEGASLPGGAAGLGSVTEVREPLDGVRPGLAARTVPAAHRELPVLGTYDVVVVGGGTSGAPAGIAAARQGCRTLVIEYLHELGGVGTLGLIGRYHCGYQCGFTQEVDEATMPDADRERGGRGWSVVRKMEWWRTELRRHGAELWFEATGCGALVEAGRVTGVVVATPEGRGAVRAKVVIDATGNADVAAAAGAPCLYTDGSCVAVQGTGLPVYELGANYTNTDFAVTDETDMVDVWQLLVYAKIKYGDGFDLGQVVDTRERRRIVGDFTLSILDHVNGRTYPDTIAQATSNLDSHGYLVAPYLALEHPGRTHCFVPYRCLLPKGLDGILVVGIGLSAHRDAIPFVRMQADLQNLGYAAGAAAAMAVLDGAAPREIDIRQLQRHLVAIGNAPGAVLAHEDSYPAPRDQIAAAVRGVRDHYQGVALLLAHREQALPLLREAYVRAEVKEDRVAYAHILAVMGDATGVEALAEEVEASPDLGDGYEYRGMGHDHTRGRVSRVDSLILALGYSRDRRATDAILNKLQLLDVDKPFSHFYAIAVALETLRDPAAADPLAELLGEPGMSGHSIQTLEQAVEREEPPLGNQSRLTSFREIVVARALSRCGDRDGLARKLLDEYTRDLRGHFARHARAVLSSGG